MSNHDVPCAAETLAGSHQHLLSVLYTPEEAGGGEPDV